MRINRDVLRQLSRAEQIQVEENLCREGWTEWEVAKLQRRLVDAARDHTRPGARRDLTGETMFSAVRDRVTALVGEAFGESHKTVERRLKILAAAEANPVANGDLLETMNNSSVGRAYEVLRIRQAQIVHAQRTEHGCTEEDLIAWAESGYRPGAIYSDNPWQDDGGLGPSRHYSMMTIQEMMRMPIGRLAADNCVLFMWVHGVHLAQGNHVPVMRAWGFEPVTIAFTWPKRNASNGYHCGIGNWTRHGMEVCVLGVKGRPLRLARDVHEIIDAPIGEHSAKPPEVRERIQRLVGGPYLELFARPPLPENSPWRFWGNEIQRDQI